MQPVNRHLLIVAALAATSSTALHAQTFATDDPTLQRIWRLGMDSSFLDPLAHALLDSIGPRLTGSPGQKAANRWAVGMLSRWGIPAREESYGTWRGWRRGATHIDLLTPRVRTLEGTMLAWSPGTKGKAVEATAVVLPDVSDSAAFVRWLPQARGKFVLVSFAYPSCRPEDNWRQYATRDSYERMTRVLRAAQETWTARIQRTGIPIADLPVRLEQAGAAGIITSRWSLGWGVNKVFGARTSRAPTIDLSCEDYGLVFRLAERGTAPRLRVRADAEFLGQVPVANVIAEIRGTERPEEYVMLSAHYDSWDGASGATDNGTGSIVMMEALRILKSAYPAPKRTILLGLWSGEEQGLNGSRAFAADHPNVVEGLQALFNQDNGTGRVVQISMQGLTGAGPHFARWFAALPSELTSEISLDIPGRPGGGGSDYASFICSGAPAFSLGSLSWEYSTYTWHTNRDTYDKLVFDDLRSNATLTAMLAYLAAEDPERVPRERRLFARSGAPADTAAAAATTPAAGRGRSRRGGNSWPECRPPTRSYEDSTR